MVVVLRIQGGFQGTIVVTWWLLALVKSGQNVELIFDTPCLASAWVSLSGRRGRHRDVGP